MNLLYGSYCYFYIVSLLLGIMECVPSGSLWLDYKYCHSCNTALRLCYGIHTFVKGKCMITRWAVIS